LSSENAIKIHDIRISCSAHATEDLVKVKEAMLFFLPEKLRVIEEITDLDIIGHAGHPIHLLELVVKHRRKILETVKYLAELLDDADKEFLFDELDSHLGEEDNCLYIRVNKQDALNETFTLDEKDNTIKLVIKLIIYQRKPQLIEKTLEEYGLIKKD